MNATKFLATFMLTFGCLLAYVYMECVQEEFIESDIDHTLIGAHRKVNPNDETIRLISRQFSLLWNEQQTESNNFFRVSCIKKGTSQVVSGVIYNLTVLLTETECKKTQFSGVQLTQVKDDELFASCPFTNNELECNFSILSKPWLNKVELVTHDCRFNE
jgi:hypothetical protein